MNIHLPRPFDKMPESAYSLPVLTLKSQLEV